MPGDWCDGFLQLVKGRQPIKGECTDADFKDSIEILSFRVGSMSGFTDSEGSMYAVQNYGSRRETAQSRMLAADESEGIFSLFASDEEIDAYEGQDLSKVEACKITVTKEMDLSSPDLFRAYCSTQDIKTRDVFDSGTVTLRKATGGARAPFLTYTFNDLVVVGYSLDVGADASPKETVTLSYGKICAEYKPQKATGKMGAVVTGGWDFIERTSWKG